MQLGPLHGKFLSSVLSRNRLVQSAPVCPNMRKTAASAPAIKPTKKTKEVSEDKRRTLIFCKQQIQQRRGVINTSLMPIGPEELACVQLDER